MWSEVIARKRNIVADVITHDGYEVTHRFDTLRRELDSCKHVRRIRALRDGDTLRTRYSAGNIFHQIDSQIHFEPGEALLFALLQAVAINVGIIGFSGIGIAANAVAKLAAKHLVDGNVVGFAGKIP